LIIGLLLFIISALVAFGFYVIEKNQKVISPLISTVQHLQLHSAEVHRWIQRIVEGQSKSDLDDVWFRLELSVQNVREMLEAGDKPPKVNLPNDLAQALKASLKGLDSDIAAYKKAVIRLLKPQIPADNMPSADHAYEQAYVAIQNRLEHMEKVINLFLQEDLLIFRKLMRAGIITCILLAALIATTFHRFLKHQADSYHALDTAYEKMRNEIRERTLAEEAQQQSATLFRTVFETSPNIVVITRLADNIVIDVNAGLTAYTGFDKQEVIGRSMIDLEIWAQPEQRLEFLAELKSKGSLHNWEAMFRAKDRRFLTCLVSARKIEINNEPHLLAVIRDVSERKQFEQKIQAANTFLMIANRHTQMPPLLREFVMEIKRVSGCSAAAVRLLDEKGGISHAAADGFSSDFCSLKEPLSVHSNKGMCVRVINRQTDPHPSLFTRHGSYCVNSTSRLLAAASEDQKRLMRNTCHSAGYETLALIPIRSGDRTLGLIQVADRQENRLSDAAIEMLEGAALQLGTAIERVSAEQALKASHDELEKRVNQRTEMLTQTKNELLRIISEHEKTEQELIGYQHRLRHLSSELLQTEERERRRIATEIHDRIGQTLAVTKIQLGALRSEFDSRDLKKRVEDIRDLVTQTIRDTRSLTFELSPPILYELGLRAALEWLAEMVHKQSGLEVQVAGDGSDRELEASKRVLLFRTCRELLFNVAKHAGATRARLSIGGDAATIMIKITDDGIGFDPALLQAGYDPLDRGFGLFSIREQVQHLDGVLEVDSTPGRGSSVTVVMPLAKTTLPAKEGLF
jgi:PAS domain S-box-containing protein